MRILIVGGGVVALLTALECVSAGHDVTVVDHTDLLFSGATSFDRRRVVRALHRDDPAATEAAARAHHGWLELERRLGFACYDRIGALSVLPVEELPAARAALARVAAPAHPLLPAELAAAYPHVRFPAGAGAILECHAGVVRVDRVLAGCVGRLRWHPAARLYPNRRVVEVDADRAAVRLADGEVLRADAVLLALGPWSPLRPAAAGEFVLHRQSMIFCEVPDAAAWAATPAIHGLGAGGDAWLVPPVAGAPLKLGAAGACRVVPEAGDLVTPPRRRAYLLDTGAAVLPGFRPDQLADARDSYFLSASAGPDPAAAVLGEGVLSHTACGDSPVRFGPLVAASLARRLTAPAPRPLAAAGRS